ncbi:hypothetical protein [Solidesulfovibrio sp.]
MISLYYDIPSYERELAPLASIPDLMPKALQRALGKTLTKLKTMFVKGVSAEAILQQKFIRAGLFQSGVTWDGDEAHGYLGGTQGKQPLFRYKASPSGPSVRRPPVGAAAQVLRASGLQTIKGSFVARMKSGHTGLFWRKPGSRLEITELLGPSVQFFFSRDSIRIPIEEQVDDIFVGFLQHEVSFLVQMWSMGFEK